MVEESDDGIRELLAHQLGNQHEVVVVDPNCSARQQLRKVSLLELTNIAILILFNNGVRKLLVDRSILGEAGAFVERPVLRRIGNSVVQGRPENLSKDLSEHG